MAEGRLFPVDIAPSSRSFKAGEYPETVFEAQNGAKSFIRYGKRYVNATMTLGFTNVSEADAVEILDNYHYVTGEGLSHSDYVTFSENNGLQGIEQLTGSSSLKYYMEARRAPNPTGLTVSRFWHLNNRLRWRYSAPPSVTSVQPGVCNVTCSFVACLEGS